MYIFQAFRFCSLHELSVVLINYFFEKEKKKKKKRNHLSISPKLNIFRIHKVIIFLYSIDLSGHCLPVDHPFSSGIEDLPQHQPLCHYLNCCPLLISWHSSLVKFTTNELSYTGISLGRKNCFGAHAWCVFLTSLHLAPFKTQNTY